MTLGVVVPVVRQLLTIGEPRTGRIVVIEPKVRCQYDVTPGFPVSRVDVDDRKAIPFPIARDSWVNLLVSTQNEPPLRVGGTAQRLAVIDQLDEVIEGVGG